MRWNDDLPDKWDAAPEQPPAVETKHAVTMEKRPGRREGQELREMQSGAWLASTAVAPLTDAVEVSE
ncbi:hypothetical protein EXE53_15355 [Halorubrum sp. SD626R]|uniref:hypothetical protein n=1 Tax=Halorubrum sp. SD626R TaxID=1419722 RepID=UPI0010F5F483|nr:hypothetical protein [Halorubrum sp. SD626R]TKX79540.1 hypothetical protein EXE53_15355 [Halorubrum sp. SD626R]